MKLIRAFHEYDFGHDWYLILLSTKQWTLFQGCLSWHDHPGWPLLQVTLGSNGLASVVFDVYRLGLTIGVVERTWGIAE